MFVQSFAESLLHVKQRLLSAPSNAPGVETLAAALAPPSRCNSTHLIVMRKERPQRVHLAGHVTAGSAMTRYSTTATVTQNTASGHAFMLQQLIGRLFAGSKRPLHP